MGTITTLRPSATSSGVGWTATPSGTLHGVTSDDSDSTYALWSGSGSALILPTPADAPPAGERRHQARLRMRGEDGDAWGAVRLTSGGLVAGTAAQFPSSPSTITGAWGTGIPADGSTVVSAYVTGQTSGVKIEELYLDVDSRLAPTFTLSVLDGSGTPSTTISDTTQPTLSAGTPDLDDLTARQYRFWVTQNGAVVWDTGVTSGPATNQQTAPLDNGSYVAHAQVWSTLGQNTAYASDEETVSFTISVGSIQAPENPTVSPVDGTPFYSVEVCAPYAGDFDGDQAYVEIQRVDCPQGGYLNLPGTGNSYASTPDPGGAPVDLEVVLFAQRSDNWFPSQEETLASHYNTVSDQRAWRLAVQEDGYLILGWSGDGTSALTFAQATERLPFDAFGRAWIRVRLDSDDGSGNWVVTFESSDDGETWTAVGDTATGSGPAPLFDSSAAYYVGAYMAGSGPVNRWTGRIYLAEVRTGAGGALIVSPDFTGRPAGTTSFTDGQGKVWTVSSPASITSDQRITSVAILGPLDTDECASYEDFTLPRTGQGVTCEHQPDPCCSYYRARTLGRVDGALQVSDWSDAYDPGIPNGMIFLWPSTDASVPAGWSRVTDLDGKYAKGVATSSTQPGTTGGATGHTHTVSGHTHDTSHTHTMSSNTSAAVGTVQSGDGATGTTAVLSSHTHTVPANTGGASVTASGSTQPTIDTPQNDPDRLMVIHMQSNGQPLGVPAGALGLAPDTSLSGWTDYANAAGRFLKGAGSGGNAGGTAASTLNNHTHAVGAHTHTGPAHTHSATTGSVTSDKSLFAGANTALWTGSHSHPITANSASAAGLNSGGSGTSGASSLGATEPPFTNVRVKENTSGGDSLPVGIIGIWRGSLGSIPNHWELCDGTSGKPNLVGRYPKGATSSIGTTGGSLNPHNHTSPSHNHTTGTHSHTMTIGAAGAATAQVQATTTVTVATGVHTHTHGDTAAATPTVGSSTSGTLANTTTEPPYEEVAFVQLVEEPTPPPLPEEFCLVWNDDEHLIRTTGPDGPLFVALGGQITWDRDRPFTSATGVMGGRFVTSSAPGGRNLHLTTAVNSEAELAELQAVLSRPLVLVSPSDAAEVWAAPVASSVKVIKIGRIRQVTADFIATGPQPAPQLADVG